MNLEVLTLQQRQEIERLTEGRIKLDHIGDNVNRIEINDPDVGLLVVVVDSYAVRLARPKRVNKYIVRWQQEVPGQILAMDREFDSESDREAFIREHLYNHNRDELVLETLQAKE